MLLLKIFVTFNITAYLIYDTHAACKGSGSHGYSGTIEQCYCECNRAVQRGFKAVRCGWFPSVGVFSSGGCNYCDSRRKRELYDVPGQVTAVINRDRRAVSSNAGPFLVNTCKCIGCDQFSGLYLGTFEGCKSYCKSMANAFINGQYTVTFLPNTIVSQGSCKCCGKKDPCSPR